MSKQAIDAMVEINDDVKEIIYRSKYMYNLLNDEQKNKYNTMVNLRKVLQKQEKDNNYYQELVDSYIEANILLYILCLILTFVFFASTPYYLSVIFNINTEYIKEICLATSIISVILVHYVIFDYDAVLKKCKQAAESARLKQSTVNK